MHTAVDLESSEQPAYKVVAGKRMSRVLTELQKETGLVYFLVLQDQVIRSSDASIHTTPAQAAELQEQSNQPTNLSLERRALSLNNHEYVSTVLPLDTSLNIELISALNVDNQIAIQQNLIRTLTAALFIIILIAFGLGVWQSQRISLPIANLADTAVNFGRES